MEEIASETPQEITAKPAVAKQTWREFLETEQAVRII
jgi:hypothetical protein